MVYLAVLDYLEVSSNLNDSIILYTAVSKRYYRMGKKIATV